MRTLLICHSGDPLNQVGLARWLGSFSDLTGIVVIRETRHRLLRRIRREIRRVGIFRFLDVLAFRTYYELAIASRDRKWEQDRLARIRKSYAELNGSIPILYTSSPNSHEAGEFIRNAAPDLMIARCKTLLKESIFTIPTRGTFVMHPGICPEYRNAHGCFWALAQGDYDHVGMTLLRVDKGVDTGAVYAYYTCEFDERTESHIQIQHRVVFDNLDALQHKLKQIVDGQAKTIDTGGRSSAAWGQPWLSRYVRWKWRVRKRERENASRIAAISYDVVQARNFESSGFPGADAAIYKLELSEFEKHITAIRDVIDRPATVRDLHLTGRPTLLTFDDGGSSAHEYIVDLLGRHDWRAHFFVTTDWIGQRGFLSPTQIRDLRTRGHLIGSHSCSHPPRMSHCSRNELRREWTNSIAVLSDILSETVDTASVPGGYYRRNVAEAAAEAGIRTLFTSEPRTSSQVVNGCLVLGRFTIQQGVPAVTAAAIAAGSATNRFHQFAYWNIKKIAKVAGGTRWLQMRKWLLAKHS